MFAERQLREAGEKLATHKLKSAYKLIKNCTDLCHSRPRREAMARNHLGQLLPIPSLQHCCTACASRTTHDGPLQQREVYHVPVQPLQRDTWWGGSTEVILLCQLVLKLFQSTQHVYVCVHWYTYMCVCVCVFGHIRECMHVCVSACIRTCLFPSLCVCVCVCMSVLCTRVVHVCAHKNAGLAVWLLVV